MKLCTKCGQPGEFAKCQRAKDGLRSECKACQKASPIYNTWSSMLARCHNPKATKYKDYGARGIKVCERWRDFNLFCQDVGPRPEGHTLDRIDCNGDYEPDNVKWSTRKQQQRNRRINRLLTFKGRTQCVAAWAEELGFNYNTIIARLCYGWSVEATLSTPIQEKSY